MWSYDFMQDRTEDGRRFRMLTAIDEFTRRCLAIVVARRLRSDGRFWGLENVAITRENELSEAQ